MAIGSDVDALCGMCYLTTVQVIEGNSLGGLYRFDASGGVDVERQGFHPTIVGIVSDVG